MKIMKLFIIFIGINQMAPVFPFKPSSSLPARRPYFNFMFFSQTRDTMWRSSAARGIVDIILIINIVVIVLDDQIFSPTADDSSVHDIRASALSFCLSSRGRVRRPEHRTFTRPTTELQTCTFYFVSGSKEECWPFFLFFFFNACTFFLNVILSCGFFVS